MLPRRRSTKPTLDPSPLLPPTSGSASSRRPLNLVTHQHPFRASTAQAIGTESPVSEIPPIPPRPATFLPSPPSSSGPRRQQTRYDTLETLYSPSFEERVQSQPLNIMPMPVPSVPQTPEPPTSPMRSRQPAGGGIGGFAPIPKFNAYSDSGLPPYETAGTSEGPHAGIWATYNKVSQEFDEKRLKKWNDDLDVLLIFVSLVVKNNRF